MKTLHELRDEKVKLENEILQKISSFQKDYDCEITNVILTSIQALDGTRKPNIPIGITLNVKI